MLSRNLYEVDEVVAALMWACKRRRNQEVVFWCLELMDTNLCDHIYRALFQFWIWQIGIARIDLLNRLHDMFCCDNEVSSRDILQLCLAFANTKQTDRDNSIFLFMVYGAFDDQLCDRTNKGECFGKDKTELEQAFGLAVVQGKARLAWNLSIPLWRDKNSRVWELLFELEHLKFQCPYVQQSLHILQNQDWDNVWWFRASAIAILCRPAKAKVQSLPFQEIPNELFDCLRRWETYNGRRKRREIAIPHECLYGLTERGKIKNNETNLSKVYCRSWKDLEGTPFWNDTLQEYQPWLSDEHKEHFWDTLFPDDIPDEWSLEDQMKSHGYGVLIQKEIPNAYKFYSRWFADVPSRLIWLGTPSIMRLFQENTSLDWMCAYDHTKSIESWNLSPVQRVFEVV